VLRPAAAGAMAFYVTTAMLLSFTCSNGALLNFLSVLFLSFFISFLLPKRGYSRAVTINLFFKKREREKVVFKNHLFTQNHYFIYGQSGTLRILMKCTI